MEQWKSWLEGWYGEQVEARHWLHQNPELSYEERETTRFVKERLTAWGVRVLGTYLLGVRLGWGAYAIALTQGLDTAIRAAVYHARFRRGTWLRYMFPEEG